MQKSMVVYMYIYLKAFVDMIAHKCAPIVGLSFHTKAFEGPVKALVEWPVLELEATS